MTATHTGREIVLETLRGAGTQFIFGNPGTTELPLLEALPDYPDLTYVFALQEAVAVSMADAYAQVSGRIGVANLHVAPGLGNAMGSLYNAWEGRTPLLVTAGQQDTRYRLREPVLWHDLVAMATPLTKWSVQAESADELPLLLHRALKVATDPPTGPVFVALPINVMIARTANAPLPPSTLYRRTPPDPDGISHAARLIASATTPVIFCGDQVARSGAIDELVTLAERIGARVHGEVLPARIDFPNQHAHFSTRGAGDYAQIRRLAADADLVLLVGGEFFEEVWFAVGEPFPAAAKLLQIDQDPRNLGRNHRLDCGLLGDPLLTLAALNTQLAATATSAFASAAAARGAALEAAKAAERTAQAKRLQRAAGNQPMASALAIDAIWSALPPNASVTREAITADTDVNRTFDFNTAGDSLGSRGGGIGQGLPGAIGMKLACPERPVLCLSGDGSALYTIQALWSAAHHRVAVVFVILNNQVYRILKYNMNRYRAEAEITERSGYPHLDLTDPGMDFVALARGFGVDARRVSDPETLREAVAEAFAANVPYLLDVVVDGSV